MLTVDYDRLGLKPATSCSTWGAGSAATRSRLPGAAHMSPRDMAVPELIDVRNTFGAMHDAGELDDSVRCNQIAGDATKLPFDDHTFDRIIASEVLEHIPSDIDALTELTRVLKPGGVIAATVPTFLPERICWAINSDYHAPTSVGGHVRIYTRGEMRAKMTGVGLSPIDAHQTHGLHSPYWWLKCAVGIDNDDHPLVKKYHELLVWEITDQPKVLQWAGKILDPLIGKSTIVYAKKTNNSGSLAQRDSDKTPSETLHAA